MPRRLPTSLTNTLNNHSKLPSQLTQISLTLQLRASQRAPPQARGMRRRGTQALPMITAVPSANRQTVHRSHSLAHFPLRIDKDPGLIYQDHSLRFSHRACAVHALTPCASAVHAPCMRPHHAHPLHAHAHPLHAPTAPAPCLRPRAVQPARPACTARSTPRTTSPLHWTEERAAAAAMPRPCSLG